MTKFLNDVFERDFYELDKITGKVLSDFFGKPKGIKFNTYVYDMNPTFWKKTDNGYTCLVHTLGISKDDIKLKIEENGVKISGETKYDELDDPFTKDFFIPIDKDILSNVSKIRYRVENGLTFIYLDVEHKENKINIEQI